MDIRQIEIVLAVEKYRNFSQAAEATYVSQATVSRSLILLEDELNIRIFDRKGKAAVELTPAGEKLLPLFQKLHACAEEITSLAGDIVCENTRQLQIGTPNCGGTFYFDSLCLDFMEKNPNIALRQGYYPSPFWAEELRSGQFDMTFVVRTADSKIPSEFDYTDIDQLQVNILLPIDHPAARDGSLNMSLLREEVFLFRTGYSDTLKQDPKVQVLRRYCTRAGFEPKIRIVPILKGGLSGMVAKGKGAAVFTMVRDAHPGTILLPIDGGTGEAKLVVSLVWRKYDDFFAIQKFLLAAKKFLFV